MKECVLGYLSKTKCHLPLEVGGAARSPAPPSFSLNVPAVLQYKPSCKDSETSLSCDFPLHSIKMQYHYPRPLTFGLFHAQLWSITQHPNKSEALFRVTSVILLSLQPQKFTPTLSYHPSPPTPHPSHSPPHSPYLVGHTQTAAAAAASRAAATPDY